MGVRVLDFWCVIMHVLWVCLLGVGLTDASTLDNYAPGALCVCLLPGLVVPFCAQLVHWGESWVWL
jgi:hypothetical protein